MTLRPTADPSVTDGVELVISVNGDGVATKTITVSFDDAKEEAPMWKAMWCSAVGETAVDERLKGFRQIALVKKFNFEHCEQPAMKPTMFNTPGILTPRTPGEKPAEAAVASARHAARRRAAGGADHQARDAEGGAEFGGADGAKAATAVDRDGGGGRHV